MIDLQEILDYYELDKKMVALILFSELDNPEHAMWRCLKTSSNKANHKDLTLEQAYILAEFIGVPIDELFTVSKWKLINNLPRTPHNIITFKRRRFIVTLNLTTGFSTIFLEDAPLISEKILVGDYIGIHTFLKTIDGIIEVLLTKKQKKNV